MHLLLVGFIGIISFYKGNWKEWRKYALTILYVINLNLLYELLCKEKILWVYNPDFFPKSHVSTSLLYNFIILPGVTLIFLSNFPYNELIRKQIIYTIKWIIVSIIFEGLYLYFGRIELHNGYKFWMEPLFYVMMYTMIRLHHTRPLLTYVISVIIIVVLLNLFNIPLK